jgi:hypothetical protein
MNNEDKFFNIFQYIKDDNYSAYKCHDQKGRPWPSGYLPLTAVGLNPDRDFGFSHENKLSI